MRGIRIDTTHFPVIFVGWSPTLSIDDVHAFGDAAVAQLAGRGPVVSLSDIRPVKLLQVTATLRAGFAAEVDRIIGAGVDLVAEATVLDGALARGMLTAYGWLRTAPRPLAAFDNVGAAERWAHRQLAERRAA